MADYDPSLRSAAHEAMSGHWQTVRDVLGGVETMRRAGTRYLPQLPRESNEDYRYRLAASPFVGIYVDLATALAAKPFANEIGLAGTVNPRVATLAEDIDGQGNNLHVFAEGVFFHALNDAISWILVDFTNVPANLNIAEEKARGARPYFVLIEAPDMLSVRWATVDGISQVVEARIAETAVVTGVDDKETTVDRVRVLLRDKTDDGYAPARWELWEKQQDAGRLAKWMIIDGGPISIGIVPLVPVVAGRQAGVRLVPVLGDCLQLQIEHYQRESALKAARTMTAYPMLVASGIEAPTDGAPITVGPSAVLYGPPTGDGKAASWSFIEPAATSLKFLADDIDRLESQMRELGRQPLTAQAGLTVVATAFAASKANSVVEALALNMKDALEQALKFLCLWLKVDAEPEISMSTDFDTGMLGETGADTLLTMHERNAISTRTLWTELRRRNILSPNFDAEAEETAILSEIPGDDDFDDRRAAMN